MIKQISAILCIILMLSINAYACTEKMILPIATDTAVATYAMPSIDNEGAKVSLGHSHASVTSASKSSFLVHKNINSDASTFHASQMGQTQNADHQPVFPLPSSLPVNRGASFIPLGTQAYLSFIQHDLVEIQPEYQLAFEFSPPVIPSFKVGYRIDAKNPSWFLTTFSKSARLSGWKESNLIYRFTQQIS